jgi:hypothetical protein
MGENRIDDRLPPTDFSLSPFTGWTRAHWEHVLARATYGYLLASERNGSPARALFPDDRCDRPDDVDALEAFSRIALAWGAWLHNPHNPDILTYQGHEINLPQLMRAALSEGTDSTNQYTYWGDFGDLDQRIVESANLSLALWLSRERVFYAMSESERARVIAWLAQVDGKKTWQDNWVLFPAFSQCVRLLLGYPAPEDDLNARLEQMRTFYRGDGWYADGGGNKFDLYNAWMFGTHYLLWAWLDGQRRPDLKQELAERARPFLASFPYFYGANGSYVAWGRSLGGRFAAIATLAIGYLLGVAPAQPGLLRRISSGNLRYFYQRGEFDARSHHLYQGYHGNFPPAAESYSSPGSPYSALHGLFGLTIDADSSFWTSIEQPLPVESGDFERTFLVPGFTLVGRQETGQVLLLNSRAAHEADVPRNDYVPKYGKFVYSSHAPFNVVPVDGSYAPDAMIALSHDGVHFGHRDGTRSGGAGPGMMWCEFDELVEGEPQHIRAAVLLCQDLQIRIARLEPTIPVRAFESPGALGCDGAGQVTRRSDCSAGWEYACSQPRTAGDFERDSRAVAIRRLLGYDAQQASRPFLGRSNLNLAYPYSEQPLVYESQPSDRVRLLASIALVRPAPFDPQVELSGITLAPRGVDEVVINFTDSSIAFVTLGDTLPLRIRLGKFNIKGEGLRFVQLDESANEIRGVGLSEIQDVIQLTAPGTLSVRRTDGATVYASCNVGFSFSPHWLGNTIQRSRVRMNDGEWVDVGTSDEAGISAERVAEWSDRTGLKLVDFCFTLG